MHDGGKILVGLTIFLAALTLPFWQNALGGPAAVPRPKIVTTEKECIRPAGVMRETHMEILNRWRDSVVRSGQRSYQDEKGKTVLMSLSRTCMRCHPNKKDFCDQCHTYLAVTPYCWDCHVEPKEQP
jgi:hypothetical protein